MVPSGGLTENKNRLRTQVTEKVGDSGGGGGGALPPHPPPPPA